MKINTSALHQTARLRSDLRIGRPVLIKNKQNIGLIFAIETLKEDHTTQIINDYRDKTYLVLTARRAETLNAIPYDGDIARILLPMNASYDWILATADPTLDLDQPFKGPFKTLRDGETQISRSAINLCKKAQLLPAALVINLSAQDVKNFDSNEILSQESNEIINEESQLSLLEATSAASLPLRGMADSRIHVFRDAGGLSEHYAIEFGSPLKNESLLVRIHCACFTGDVVGSLKCDCGDQLKNAIQTISKNGSGILIYLNQEGRGIGLTNKMRAYKLQNQGFDTVEANHRLGFEDEERDLRVGAQIIKMLGFKKIRLLTNNPKKVKSMSALNIIVTERLDLLTEPRKENAHYLSTKAIKSGHIMKKR